MDGCRGGLILGWARWPDARRARVIVELLVDGVVVGDALAMHYRGDLADAGMADSVCGFALACDAAFLDAWPGGAFQAVLRAQGGEMLPGGLLELDETQLNPAETTEATVWPPLMWRIEGDDAEGYLDQFGPAWVTGWIHRPSNPSPPVLLDIAETGKRLATLTANIWRPDLAGARQGDGRWGFKSPMPACLLDGRWHSLDIRARDGTEIFPGPIQAKLPARHVNIEEDSVPAEPELIPPAKRRRDRNDAPGDTVFSFVINFYNMRREANRTLTSLTRAYQRGIGDLAYEVLCIDNGSDPPLDADWVAGFGPEFRLLRPKHLLASPCAALNEAAAQANGRYVAVMIDGAHVLTPGVLREAWDALTEAPEAVVAVRQWFVGGDQRWLSEAGYTTDDEDLLFDRIAWPDDGYELFTISMPVWESPSHWLDGLGESNCLFVPAEIYRAIGGMDEAFKEAGAGFANLDLFHRAAAASPEPLVALIGEATFHQFHGGTTTNAIEALKEQRVRSYENHYITLRGEPLRVTRSRDVRVRGQMPFDEAKFTRQGPLSPIGTSITARTRPGNSALHFDNGAQAYASSTYAECGLHARAAWMGRPVGIAPSDLLAIQELIFRLRPERIVAVNLASGLLWFLHQITGLNDGLACRIVTVSMKPPPNPPPPVICVSGDPASPAVRHGVGRALGTAETVLVLFAPNPGDTTPDGMLRDYAAFVSPRSYLVFVGSVFGQPWLGYSKNWFLAAITKLVGSMPFVVDATVNPHLITTSPMGYLQRIGGLLEAPSSAPSSVSDLVSITSDTASD